MDPLANPPRDRVYLLDAHGMVFQMFHGIPQMNAPDGRPTNAVFGVTRALMNLYDHGAEYLIAVFDDPAPTFRVALDPQYKANRPPPPSDLILQEPLIHQVLEALRVPILVNPGFEADDVMATVAAAADARGQEVFLCTSDKDCRQLLTDRVKIMNLRKNELMDKDALVKDWGVTAEQVVDFQALVGDSVDNVPGVPGCGPKTAAKWLQQYGTLENIIANADALGGPKLKEAFKTAHASGKLALSRELVKLRADVPMTFDWDGWKRRDWHGQRLLELFQEFGFHGFANKVRATLSASGAKKNAAMLADIGAAALKPTPIVRAGPQKPRPGASLFDQIDADDPLREPEPPPPPDDWSYAGYELIATAEAFAPFLEKLKAQPRFALDLETTSLDTHLAEIVGYAISWQAGVAYYLAVRGPASEPTLDSNTTLAALQPILENPAVAKLNQNIKYDRLVLQAHGVELRGVRGDSMIAHYLLNSGERSHNLDDLTRTYLKHENLTIESLIGKGRKQKSMADIPTAKVKDYAAEDADTAWQLTNLLEAQLAPQGLRAIYDDVEIPLIEVLAAMEFHGVRIDTPFLAKLSAQMAGELAAVEEKTHALAGKTFNIASPKQLREILFGEMKLRVQKRTGTTGEASTDQDSLERLAALGHPLPTAIIEHRQISKLKGTYVDALPMLVNPKTGRVHTSFNQTVATTGRLSSSDPNLQNIPARTEQGRQIRQAFIPPDGWRILTADYSQVELRLLAHFCGDPVMSTAFAEDKDVHARVAAEIYKVPEAEVTGDQRRIAKTVNFGVIYGMSGFGLAARLGIPRKEAETFIDAYFARHPKVLEYQDRVIANAREIGYVSTILGRKRTFEPTALRAYTSYKQRNQAEREAINMEIQGSAADLMKLALLGVHRRMTAAPMRAKMLLTVHDELVFEAPPDEVVALADLVRSEMVGAMTLRVPLKVDVGVGVNWLDVDEV